MGRRQRLDLAAEVANMPPADAERLLQKHLKRRPKDADAIAALAGILAEQDRLSEIASPLVGAAMNPDATAAIIGYACEAAHHRQEHEAARRIAVHGTTLHPDIPEMWLARGHAEVATANAAAAAVSLERAHELAPGDTSILAALADADLSRGAFPVPDLHAKRLVELEPDVAAHHVRLGTAMRFNNRLAKAEDAFRRAIALDPLLQSARAGLAETLESTGESEAAAAALADLMNGPQPSFAVVSAWARIQQRLGDRPSAISAMERYLASQRGGLSHRSNMLMRLGRAYEQAGRADDAFRCWQQGNAAHRGRWDAKANEAFVDAMIDTLDASSLPDLPHAPAAPFTPVLVVGMYRSGTTLTEQILSAHSMITPAGESPAMPEAVKTLATAVGPLAEFPVSLTAATQDAINAAAASYVEQIQSHVQGSVIVDKLPMNYLNLGIASLLLPNAKVLYLLRDPLDTAISCFSQSFASSMAFTTDLEHLGRAIQQERRIMAHWKACCGLPIHVVSYETLVSEPEQTLRGVLAFLGLPWEDSVLEFHTSKRVAATPSMDQVRKPINTSAVGRATKFEAHLKPLHDALRPSRPAR
jgi:tetratricopeptide (TPR) repeat protein